MLARDPADPTDLVGEALSYSDLSRFQLVTGLRFALSRAMARWERSAPHCVALRDAAARLATVSAYLASRGRIAFNNDGIVRRYRRAGPPSVARPGQRREG